MAHGVHLHYSNQTEALIRPLVDDLRRERGGDFFVPATIIVPNKNMEAFLQLQIAAEEGIAANLDYTFLRKYLARLACEALPGIRILEREAMRSLLLAILDSEIELAGDALYDVRAYLHAAGGAPGDVDLRRFQLATRLSERFAEYQFSRPAMLAAWNSASLSLAGTRFETTERWQAELWRSMHAWRDRLGDETRSLFLTEIWEAFAKAGSPESAALHALAPRPVFIFGISYMARAFHGVLQTLGAWTRVYVYALNPCAEFWEDVPTWDETHRRRLRRQSERVGPAKLALSEDPFELDAAQDPPALRLWGRPGRENIRLLNELTDCDFRGWFVEPNGDTLLRRLQRDVLQRTPGTAAEGEACDDGSIRFLGAPGVMREVEVVANEIWRLVHVDGRSGPERLRFNDIAVIVNEADKESYFTHIRAVFDDLHRLPYSIVDHALASENRAGEALELLLRLPDGKFGRADFLRFLTHPLVGEAFVDGSAGEWKVWCERVNILFGADEGDLAGTYLEGEDVVTWDQGLKRLVLGNFIAGGSEPYAGALFPEEVPPSQASTVSAMVLLARSLIADIRYCRSAELTLSEWADLLARLTETYLRGGTPDEREVVARCVQSLHQMAEADLVELPPDERRVSYRIASEYARELIVGLEGRGRYLADGVVVSSFKPMRAIPFKVVFVLGMGEGKFPAAVHRDPLDLRYAQRMAGDVSTRERDKYMFLETLLSTRERLYVSWVSRQAQTGDPLEPSTVVREFESILGLGQLTQRHPLNRYDGAYFQEASLVNYSIAARNEAQALALRHDLHIHAEGVLPPAKALYESLGEPGRNAVAPLLSLPQVTSRTLHVEDDARRQVSASTLRSFLDCPLQGSAKLLLRLRDDSEDDMLLVEDEAFSAGPMENAALLREAFVLAGGNADAIDDIYEPMYRRYCARGAMPAGFFAEPQRRRHHEVFAVWQANLRELGIDGLEGYRVLRFGRSEREVPIEQAYLPIRLTEAGGIELNGTTELWSADGCTLVLLLARGKPKDADWLRGFWSIVLASAAGAELPATVQFIACGSDPIAKKLPVKTFNVPSRDEAAEYLTALYREATSRAHDYLFPIEAALKVLAEIVAREGDAAHTWISLRDLVADVIEGDSYSSLYGPVSNIDRFEAPTDEECEPYVTERFGLYRTMLGGGA